MAEKGYIKLARRSIESDIWRKPPLYWKIWTYILMRAYYEDTDNLKKGELLLTIDELIEAGSYYIGYRKIKPSRRQIVNVLNYLRKPRERSTNSNMIVSTKVTHGLLVKVLKYRLYQSSETYEGYHEEYHEKTPKVKKRVQLNKKNTKEEKEEEKEVINYRPTLKEIEDEVSRKSYIIEPSSFYDFFEASGWTNPADGKPIKSWKKVLKAWNNHALTRKPGKVMPIPDYIAKQRDELRETIRLREVNNDT